MTENNNGGQMYEVKKWGNKDNYVCKMCPYATLEFRKILEHIAEQHEPRVQEIETRVLSATGKPLVKQVVQPPRSLSAPVWQTGRCDAQAGAKTNVNTTEGEDD